MPPLNSQLQAARRKQFVGREAEIALFQSALAAPELPFYVLHVFGPGGVGKTLAADPQAGLPEDSDASAIWKALNTREERCVILIDTYETLLPLEGWLRDVRRVASYFAEDYVGDDVAVASQMRGPRDVRRYVTYNFLGFPDLRFELHDTIAQGNRIALIWTVRGTHKGKVMNIPPTGAQIEARGISVRTVKDGKIVRSLRVWDVAGMLRHIGLLPDLPAMR